MLDILNPEKQINKRVQSFLLHKSTQENIDATKAKLLFKIAGGKPSVHLYEENRHAAQINIHSIFDFFGIDYEENHIVSLKNYLEKISKEEKLDPEQMSVVICNVRDTLGAHLYEGHRYQKKISTFGLLTHFYFHK